MRTCWWAAVKPCTKQQNTTMEFLKILDYIKKEGAVIDFEQKINISILRNHTVENLVPYLTYYLYRSRIRPAVTLGGYNNMVQEAIDPDAEVYRSSPQVIVLSLTLHEYMDAQNRFTVNTEAIKGEIALILDSLLKNSAALIVTNTFLLPFFGEWGISNTGSSCTAAVAELNSFIEGYSASHPSRIFCADFNRLTRQLGEERSMDYRFGYSSKLYFKNDFFDAYAREVSKVAKALMAKNKKVLVLDCDNTLWKGIIGEDGMDGIKLGKASSPGNIFYDFQSTVLQLQQRGVIIALCSKNNEEDVFEVLDKHPESPVRRQHLAAWKVNWDNKVQNIIQLSEELNIGLDYFVFVDDNPVECNLVKEHLPMVEVVQVPEKLYLYPDILLREGFFDTLTISEEDKKRNQLYQAESLRKHSQKNFSDIKDYLHALGIGLTIGIDHAASVPRLAQLTQKTNQFNLTTRRYSEEEVKSFQNDANASVMQFAVKDKYGDMGLTGMLIYKAEGQSVSIDTFLLSCRILGRDIELAFMDYCLAHILEKHQPAVIRASYLKSRKNAQTENFWQKIGFEQTGENDGNKEYELKPENFKKKNYDYITIHIIN